MSRLRIILFCGIILAAVGVPAASAQGQKQAIVTFSEWVEIPGGVLPAGRWLFRQSSPNTVQIYDPVSRILVATLPTEPDVALRPEEGQIRFESRPGPFQSPAVAEWFRPGSRVGQVFVYTSDLPFGEGVQVPQAMSRNEAPGRTGQPRSFLTTSSYFPPQAAENIIRVPLMKSVY